MQPQSRKSRSSGGLRRGPAPSVGPAASPGAAASPSWLASTPVLLFAALALSLGLLAAGSFVWIVGHRLTYPYDLEWMEGSMLHHALRLQSGQPIYTAPSVDFIPHLYTPLYPLLVAGLGKLVGGVGYAVGRALSVGAFAGALLVAVGWARREGGSLVAALCALALPLAAFADTGGFYDLVRCDSLALLLTVSGLAVAWIGRRQQLPMVAAALLLVAAFFAKQTAAPLIAFGGIGLLMTRRRPVLTFAAVGVAAFAVLVYAQNRASDGWFWIYIFRLHQSHAFFGRRAWVETPLLLVRLLGPALLVVPWALLSQALGRQREPAAGLYFLSWLGLGGFVAACLSFGTQWAHVNALIPGIFFPALAIGAAAGRLLRRTSTSRPQTAAHRHGRALRSGLVFVLLAASLGLRLPGLKPSQHIPTAADRAAGDAVIARLRSAPGEVLIPFHPFYAHLAGKPVYLHRMGVWDVRNSVAGPVRGLDAAFVQRRFSQIIFDDKVEATWADWPEVLQNYQIVERFVGPQVVEGARTRPSLVLLPLPNLDRELQ